jgi:hypothetical protein
MARYFFHCEGYENFRDEVGTELPDLPAAKAEIIRMAGQILTDHPDDFANSPKWRLTLEDAERRPLFHLRFSAMSLT